MFLLPPAARPCLCPTSVLHQEAEPGEVQPAFSLPRAYCPNRWQAGDLEGSLTLSARIRTGKRCVSPLRQSCHRTCHSTTSLGQEQSHPACPGTLQGTHAQPCRPHTHTQALAGDRGRRLSGLRWRGGTQWDLRYQKQESRQSRIHPRAMEKVGAFLSKGSKLLTRASLSLQVLRAEHERRDKIIKNLKTASTWHHTLSMGPFPAWPLLNKPRKLALLLLK